MIIYIDESGSINNKLPANQDFIISLVVASDKKALARSYKRFVSANYDRLKELDQDKLTKDGRIIRAGGKMFTNEKFSELKGSQFDKAMKQQFVQFFSQKDNFEWYIIRLHNCRLTDKFCNNSARAFNYSMRLALNYFISNGYLPNEDCYLQLDERNEKTETRHFLANYLNTELTLSGESSGNFTVEYFDSSNNKFIQISDVLANIYYSHVITGAYEDELRQLKDADILKYVFEFPLSY